VPESAAARQFEALAILHETTITSQSVVESLARSRAPAAMGRRKIEIKAIKDDRNRSV
jgi:hypothetical protein